MKFHKILGKCDPAIIQETEDKLTSVFTELPMSYSTKAFGSKIGGDVFIYVMISSLKHICDVRAIEFDAECIKINQEFEADNVPTEQRKSIIGELKRQFGGKLLRTCATNGKEFFYNPTFINSLSRIGLRLVVGHESWHSIYLHPTRRGSRNPALWNQVVDFKVNHTLMNDLKLRGFYNYEEIFKKELGDYITLKEYSEFLKDPFSATGKLAGWNPMASMKKSLNPGYQAADDKENKSLYYAEPNLTGDLLKPENIYSYLMSCIPKCSTCGKIGHYKKPQEFLDLEKQVAEMQADTADAVEETPNVQE